MGQEKRIIWESLAWMGDDDGGGGDDCVGHDESACGG